MPISSEQQQTLADARVYEMTATWSAGICALIGAIDLGISVENNSRGGIASAIVLLLIAFWLDQLRRSYRADIKYLQEQA